MNYKIDVQEVKGRAEGRWEDILARLAPSLAPALDKPFRHVPCPVHGGKDGFRLLRRYREVGSGACNTCGKFKDGFALLQFVNGWTFKEALESVADELGIGPDRNRPARELPVYKPPVVDTAAEDEKKRKALRWVYRTSVPIGSPIAEPARRYLANRGLHCYPSMLRMHPGLMHVDENGNKTGPYPTLIALVTDADGRGVTIHRTYLTPDGYKAPVPEPKKQMSSPSDAVLHGAAIKLFPYQSVLGVSEGIETAIAAFLLFGIPTWPLLNSAMLPYFVPPSDVEMLVVFADKDRPSKLHPKGAGQEAAMELVRNVRKLGFKATLEIPSSPIPDDKKSVDWDDEYGHRETAFRRTLSVFKQRAASNHGANQAPQANQ